MVPRSAVKLAKAALNQEIRTIAMDLKTKGSQVALMATSPGWVKKKLSGCLGDTDIDGSVDGIISVMEGLTIENTGEFWNWDGERLAW